MKMRQLTLSVFFLLITNAITNAQSLPGKQTAAVWLPSTVKIDGKADEWNNSYQAYNHGAEVYYTIANDNDNLYVVIHAVKSGIIEKIMEGGVSFTVSGNSKIKEDKDFTVLFPLLRIPDCRNILRTAGKTLSEGSSFGRPPGVETEKIEKVVSIGKANELLHHTMKEIKVAGAPTVVDTIPGITPKTPYYSFLPLRSHNFKVITLANHDGLEATTQFANDGTYTYELLVPLKLAKISAAKTPKLKYKITLNARGEDARMGNTWWYTHTKPQEIMYLDLETKSDFSGEYTLAKK